jgi:hypothetical protein
VSLPTHGFCSPSQASFASVLNRLSIFFFKFSERFNISVSILFLLLWLFAVAAMRLANCKNCSAIPYPTCLLFFYISRFVMCASTMNYLNFGHVISATAFFLQSFRLSWYNPVLETMRSTRSRICSGEYGHSASFANSTHSSTWSMMFSKGSAQSQGSFSWL